MKYIEFQNAVQQYLNRHGHIEGYISQQERMARFACNDVIEKFPMPYKLSLVRSSGCGIFYELHASIPLETTGPQYDAVIGMFTNNGAIRKQAIQLYLYGTEKYGDEEFTRAVRMVAIDALYENFTRLMTDYKRISSEADMIHEKVNRYALIRQQPHPFIMNGWGLQERACPFSVSPVDQPQPRQKGYVTGKYAREPHLCAAHVPCVQALADTPHVRRIAPPY